MGLIYIKVLGEPLAKFLSDSGLNLIKRSRMGYRRGDHAGLIYLNVGGEPLKKFWSDPGLNVIKRSLKGYQRRGLAGRTPKILGESMQSSRTMTPYCSTSTNPIQPSHMTEDGFSPLQNCLTSTAGNSREAQNVET